MCAEKLVVGLLKERRCGYVTLYKCKMLIVDRYEAGLTHIRNTFLCIWIFNLLGDKTNVDNIFYFIKYLFTVATLRVTAALCFLGAKLLHSKYLFSVHNSISLAFQLNCLRSFGVSFR